MRRLKTAAAIVAMCLGTSAANATIIEFDATHLDGATWRYDYTVTNNSLEQAIEEFSIFFSLGLYQDIVIGGAPAGWDPIAIQPDGALPDDGFYDALAFGAGIASGQSLGVFSATFIWLGTGTPGSQTFHILDPLNLSSPLETGSTQRHATPPQTSVPEPGTLTLFGFALMAALAVGRRQPRSSPTTSRIS
jgi:hypothetical protein